MEPQQHFELCANQPPGRRALVHVLLYVGFVIVILTGSELLHHFTAKPEPPRAQQTVVRPVHAEAGVARRLY